MKNDLLTYCRDDGADEVEGAREVPALSLVPQVSGPGSLGVRLQQDVQLGDVHRRVALQEWLEYVVVSVPLLHLVVPLQEHKHGGPGEHVDDHDDGEKHKSGIVLSEVQ